MRSESSTAAPHACFSSSFLDSADQVRRMHKDQTKRGADEKQGAEREREPPQEKANELSMVSFACHDLDLFLLSPRLQTNKQADQQPLPVLRTATLRDLTPTDKAKVSRLLRRVLSLSADNERLSSVAAASAAARGEGAAELRKRLDVALDSLAEARRRAEAAESKLRATAGSCVCGAAAGAGAAAARGGAGQEEEENRENFFGRSSSSRNAPQTTTTGGAPASGRRALVFNESKGAFEFEASREEQQQRRKAEAFPGDASVGVSAAAAAAPPPPSLPQRGGGRDATTAKSLQGLVADVERSLEASLAAAAPRR